VMKRQEQVKRWEGNLEAARITDQLRTLFFGVDINNPQYQHLLTELDAKYRLYAPARFIKEQFRNEAATIPYLLEDTSVTLLDEKGGRVVKVISAVVARVSDIRASLVFVDNDEKIIYGSTYFDGDDLDETISNFVNEVLATIDDTYSAEAERALREGKEFPPLNPTMDKIRNIVQTKCGTPQDS
jgi:hypothetical protein